MLVRPNEVVLYHRNRNPWGAPVAYEPSRRYTSVLYHADLLTEQILLNLSTEWTRSESIQRTSEIEITGAHLWFCFQNGLNIFGTLSS